MRGFISSGIWRQDWSGVSLLGYMETGRVSCLSLGVHGDRTGELFISSGTWRQDGWGVISSGTWRQDR